jgi:predicted nucleotidyltransferase component of viral defense system
MDRGKIPLAKVLKGKTLKIAELQDALVLELAKGFSFILHGGLAIWRIYGGKRFSYNIDVYQDDPPRVAERLAASFKVVRARYTRSGTLYLRVREEVEVELEVRPLAEGPAVEADYWLVDGSSIVVRTLSPEGLLREKVRAFLNRNRARDLYDIYYLLDLCEPELVASDLRTLLRGLREPPDIGGLKELVLMGLAPSFQTMKVKVMRYAQA